MYPVDIFYTYTHKYFIVYDNVNTTRARLCFVTYPKALKTKQRPHGLIILKQHSKDCHRNFVAFQFDRKCTYGKYYWKK